MNKSSKDIDVIYTTLGFHGMSSVFNVA